MVQSAPSSQVLIDSIKIGSMVFMFSVIILMGSLPIRLQAFNSNKVLLACTAAFSGGLFFSVGLLHLLAESSQNFNDYFNDGLKGTEHFPYAYLTATLSFAFVLWIEKIAVSHQHDHHEHTHSAGQSELSKVHEEHSQENASAHLIERNNSAPIIVGQSTEYQENCTQDEEQNFRNQVSVKINVAKKINFTQRQKQTIRKKKQSVVQQGQTNLTPYILQIAIGMHAVFEGLSIGIERRAGACLGLAIAVACHKWVWTKAINGQAEGLTLGLAFRQAGVEKCQATTMIFLQALMNPIGISIGWAMSSSGPLIVGIFYGISSDIPSQEEFSISRYKWAKYLLFLVAIGLVSSLWFIEQATTR